MLYRKSNRIMEYRGVRDYLNHNEINFSLALCKDIQHTHMGNEFLIFFLVDQC